MTMTLVSTVTVGVGGAASIEFTGIPQTGKDLYLIYSVRGTSANATMAGRFNGSALSLYSFRRLYGITGSITGSDNATTGTSGQLGDSAGTSNTANTFGNQSVYIPNYTSAAYKSWSVDSVDENNATTSYLELVAGLWSSTSAITSLSLFNSSGNLAQYSTASLYTISTTGATGATVA